MKVTPPVNRTTAQLADGRDIFFYDDETRTRSVHDGRDIARPEGANEMRFDPLLGEWTAVAAARQNRTHKPSADACPLCPSTPERATEVPEAGFDVVVFENRFPSFRGEAPVPPDVLEHLGRRRRRAGSSALGRAGAKWWCSPTSTPGSWPRSPQRACAPWWTPGRTAPRR